METFSKTQIAAINTLVEANTNTEGMVEAPTDVVDRALEEIVVKPKRTTKKKREPDAPKRPMSAYFLWLGKNRESIGEEYCSELTGRDKVIGTTRKAGELWKALSDEEKIPFTTKAETLREEYYEKMKLYKPEMAPSTKKKKTSGPKYDPADIPATKDGWSGPFQMKYLKIKVKGKDGKSVRIIKNFDEAIMLASEINTSWQKKKDEDDLPEWWSPASKPCGGITKTSTGYDLRLSADLLSTDEKHQKTGIASWVFGKYKEPTPMSIEPEPKVNKSNPEPVPEPEVNKSNPEPVPEPKVKKSNPEPEPEPKVKKTNPEPVPEPKVKKTNTVKKLKMKKKTPEPQPKYPAEDMEEIEIEKNGKDVTYLLHEESGDVFEPTKLNEPVGKVDEDEGEIVFF